MAGANQTTDTPLAGANQTIPPGRGPQDVTASIQTSVQGQGLSFKILTLNTHKGFNYFNRRFVLHELREAVRAMSADIVFLQEVLGGHELHQVRHQNWPAVPQYEFLADTLWTDFAYGRNAVYPAGHHGNAVMSKFPIVRYDNHDVSIGTLEKRGLLHCLIRVPGRTGEMHVICAHLALIGSHRRQQLALLCKLVREQVPADAPLIIAGDFNDWRTEAHDLLGACGLREAFVDLQGRAPRTFPAFWPMLRLDRVYFRHAQARNPAVHSVRPWSHLSDHAALSVEFQL